MVIDGVRSQDDIVNVSLQDSTTLYGLLDCRSMFTKADDFVVDTTVNIHLTKHLADLPLHRALESGLTTQALALWMAFRGMHPQDALHIVKQKSHRYTYGNGRADTHAKHQNTKHTTRLEHGRLDIPHQSHLQQPPPIPSATQPLH